MSDRFVRARADPSLVVLEGFHALKHAIRFDAEFVEVVCSDAENVKQMAGELAPDISDRMGDLLIEVPEEAFGAMTRFPPATGVVAIARRPNLVLDKVLGDAEPKPMIFLEESSNPWNVGTAIRVAAAAGAAGVMTSGSRDPWHPAAVTASAGLHFALPVFHAGVPPICRRPLVAVHPEGDPLPSAEVPERAILAFGTERGGLSQELLSRADLRVAIPMEKGVSSLNLATAVAVILYSSRLSRAQQGPDSRGGGVVTGERSGRATT